MENTAAVIPQTASIILTAPGIATCQIVHPILTAEAYELTATDRLVKSADRRKTRRPRVMGNSTGRLW